MERKQQINCTVKSCVYQDEQNKRCTLQSVEIMPVKNCCTGKCDESMCGSYDNGK